MEELKIEKSNKRPRVESGLDSASDSPESKRVISDRVDSDPTRFPNQPESDVLKADVDLDSPEAKQIREDILDILDEPDDPPEIEDLDSVMKSFEEEILHCDPQTVLDLTTSESGDSQPDLGYLFEASDDELGLPPTFSPAGEHVNADGAAVMPEAAAECENFLGFEHEMPNYDSFDFGMAAGVTDGDNNGGNINGEFVTVGGLFEYPEPTDFSEFSWRQESLPAL